jgi:hypothetical protein
VGAEISRRPVIAHARGRATIAGESREERIREPEAEIAERGVLQIDARAGDRADAGAALAERDREDRVELEAPGHADRPEEAAVHLVVDDVLIAPFEAGRRNVKDDRPRQVRRDEAEADVPRRDRLGAADPEEAAGAGVRPKGVVVDARAGERAAVALGRTRGSFAGDRGQWAEERHDRQD